MAISTNLNIINLQVQAEDQIAIDKENGTYESNLASNSKYYLWQSDFQTIPVSMFGNPQLYAERLRDALPEVTTLRLPFNSNSFNADGSLHPQYEQFLQAAVNEGFNLILVQMDGDAQDMTAGGPDAEGTMRDALTGEVFDRVEQTWSSMLDWLDAHPSVKNSVYAHEILNEPAAYNQAALYSSSRSDGLQEFVSLYAAHMVDLGLMIEERSGDARIMVGGWNYSAQFQQLSDINVGGVSALEYIRSGIGEKLIWSAHLYPGWLGTEGVSDPAQIRLILEQIYGPVLDDTIILTETNAQGNEVYNLIGGRPEVQGFAQVYDWFADHDIAIGWFTGSQYGESNLSRMDPDGTLRFVQQGSYGAAMDAFSLGAEPLEHASDEQVTIQLIEGRLRNQIFDPDYQSYNEFDIAQFIGLGFGYGGNDSIAGSLEANNFLYGGTGNDHVIGNARDDFLYGQDGDDIVDGGVSGHDHLFGGRGNDRLIAGYGSSQMYGGAGSDTFVIHPHGLTVIADFDPTEGDFLVIRQRGFDEAALISSARALDWDGVGLLDLSINVQGRGEVILINMGGQLSDVVGALLTDQWNSDPISVASVDEVLLGRPGVDILYGGSGNDTIYGDPEGEVGSDQLFGGVGNDIIWGRGAFDLLDGGDGDDTLMGGDGDDSLIGGLHDDLLFGEGGNDFINADNGADIANGGLGNDSIYGGGGSDTLYGENGFDIVDGGGGNDLIFGGNGIDTLAGGNGNDLIYGDEANDFLYGHRGNDTLHGGSGQDYLSGGEADDVLHGNDSHDTLFGDSGNDTLYGGDQYDFLSGGEGDDQLDGGAGEDTLDGGLGNDSLVGGIMNDTLRGGQGDDVLSGGAGIDWISGGPGQDTATGGTSADTFVFNLGDGALTITDFSTGQGDILQIDEALLYGEGSMDRLREHTATTASGVLIEFEDGHTILIENFFADLSESFVRFI